LMIVLKTLWRNSVELKYINFFNLFWIFFYEF